MRPFLSEEESFTGSDRNGCREEHERLNREALRLLLLEAHHVLPGSSAHLLMIVQISLVENSVTFVEI